MARLNLPKFYQYSSTGWKKAAKVNCVVLIFMSVALVVCLIVVASQNGGSQKALFFYNGDCDEGSVSQVNTALHLLINVISTLILASSNFFMQVLNSPSREEVNMAHFKGSWLGIGVPSVRNVAHVSKFKTWSWVVLLLSSIPIHLLFNSTIFQTDHRESEFHLIIATENFVNAGPFNLPGASLFPAGLFWDGYWHAYGYSNGLFNRDDIAFSDALAIYADQGSGAIKNTTTAATNGHQWSRLDIQECEQEYVSCSGLKQHRSLILVADKPGGWIRDQMWHLNDNQTKLWDKYVPSDEPNHLFFENACKMEAVYMGDKPTYCDNNCNDIFPPFNAFDWQYSFIDNATLDRLNRTSDPYVPICLEDLFQDCFSDYAYNYYYYACQPGAFDLSIKYCLAEPLDRVCHVALSPTLLIGVTICVIVKTCTAILVTVTLVRRRQTPLVTLGDAIVSFIEKPDPITVGLCTFGQDDARKLSKTKHASQDLPLVARQWQPLRKRRGAVVPISVWSTSYFLFALGIAVCGTCFGIARQSKTFWGSFFESDQNAFSNMPFTFFEGVMTANSPQLLLSFCYLAYNNLFTRLQMAREWALFSEECLPLRVTDPQGEQYATYRLQLPYKYSLPLIAVSIFLHWMLSNIIYLFVSTGGYYGPRFTNNNSNIEDRILPPGTAVAVGFSTYSLLAMLIVSCFLILIPILLSLKRLAPNMVNIGSNSFALSAACHVSKLSYAAKFSEDTMSPYLTEPSRSLDYSSMPLYSAERVHSSADELITDANLDGIEMQQLVMTRKSSSRQSLAAERLMGNELVQEDDGDGVGERSLFRNLARSKIRWGVVHMHPEWYAHVGMFEHLSFGVEEDNVQAPVQGRRYA